MKNWQEVVPEGSFGTLLRMRHLSIRVSPCLMKRAIGGSNNRLTLNEEEGLKPHTHTPLWHSLDDAFIFFQTIQDTVKALC